MELCLTYRLPEPEARKHILFAGTADPKDRKKIGFLPWPCFQTAHQQENLATISRNGDLVGYCLFRVNRDRELHIVQTWVRADARLILHGRMLIDFVESEAKKKHHNLWRIRLWCATDLAANFFWSALGFTRGPWRWGSIKRYRKHWLWTRRIAPDLAPYRERRPSETQEAPLLSESTSPSILPPQVVANCRSDLSHSPPG